MVETWSETALVTINILDNTEDFHFACITETIDIDAGEKGFDSIKTLKPSRLIKFMPEEDTTVTLELYPTEIGFDEATGANVNGVYNLLFGPITVTGGKIDDQNDNSRRQLRVVLRWTDESATDATAALDEEAANLRLGFADGYMISAKPSFTDGILKFTCEFKFVPYDRAGDANYLFQSTASGAVSTPIAALGNYTSGTPSNSKF